MLHTYNFFLNKNNTYVLFKLGVTRQTVMEIVRSLGIPLVERRISLAEFHSAEEVFTTGTVYQIDGHRIRYEEAEDASIGAPATSITRRIQEVYRTLTLSGGVKILQFENLEKLQNNILPTLTLRFVVHSFVNVNINKKCLILSDFLFILCRKTWRSIKTGKPIHVIQRLLKMHVINRRIAHIEICKNKYLPLVP